MRRSTVRVPPPRRKRQRAPEKVGATPFESLLVPSRSRARARTHAGRDFPRFFVPSSQYGSFLLSRSRRQVTQVLLSTSAVVLSLLHRSKPRVGAFLTHKHGDDLSFFFFVIYFFVTYFFSTTHSFGYLRVARLLHGFFRLRFCDFFVCVFLRRFYAFFGFLYLEQSYFTDGNIGCVAYFLWKEETQPRVKETLRLIRQRPLERLTTPAYIPRPRHDVASASSISGEVVPSHADSATAPAFTLRVRSFLDCTGCPPSRNISRLPVTADSTEMVRVGLKVCANERSLYSNDPLGGNLVYA